MTDMQRVALAGVLEQTGKDTLCVQPDFLRGSTPEGNILSCSEIALPWNLCETLIKSSEEPALGYLELILSRGRARAAIPDQHLREICVEVNDERLWNSMAWLDESNCRWVVESFRRFQTT